MLRPGIYYIHVKDRLKSSQRFAFTTKRDRAEYLAREKAKAVFKRQPFTYKRGEYLRVYRNPRDFTEYDIKGDRQSPLHVAGLVW